MTGSGLYAIVIHLARPKRVTVGKLGVFMFPAGVYVYTGSAIKNLESRVSRHRKKIKTLRWHIDYLRENSSWAGAVVFPGMKEECALAARIFKAAGGATICKGFGSSDCHCESHLAFSGMGSGRTLEVLERLPGAAPWAPPRGRSALFEPA
ncbi:MAG: GIY-YIG nuclease family protein [Nitrospinae bacterium]|nr:GIY-YIG nuclease family protein [Nitrospinota bacterium]